MDHLSLFVIVGYLALTTLIGSLLARRSRGSSQWAVAGGAMGALMIAVGVAGTRIGGAGVYGVAADVIHTGMWNTWYAVYTFLAMALVGLVYAKPYRRLGLMTVSEIFIKRFGSRRLQVLTSLCVQTEYLIVNIIEPFVIAKILVGVAPGLNYYAALAIAGASLISYTALGGLWGAAATNLIHCAVILIGLFAVGFMGTVQLGGFDELARGVDAALAAAGRDPAHWWSFTGAGVLPIIAMFFSTTIHTPAASVYTNYSTAAREEKALARGFIAGGLIAALMPLFAAWIGAATLAKFGADAQAKSYLSITQLATSVNPFIGAVALAAVLAAVVSSGGPILLASATMFVRDWIPGSREMTSEKQLRLYRITTIIYGALAAALAAKMQGSVLEWLLLGFAAVVPPAIVVTYLLYWPRATEQGAFWGIVSGYAGGVIWYLFSEHLLGLDKAALENAGGFIRWAHDFFVTEKGEILDPAYATTLIPVVVTPVVSMITKQETERRDEFYATIRRAA